MDPAPGGTEKGETNGGIRANDASGTSLDLYLSPRGRDTHQPKHQAPSHNRSTTGDGASPEGELEDGQATQCGATWTSTGQKQPPTLYLLQPPTSFSKSLPYYPETSPLKQPAHPYTLKSDQPNPGGNGDSFTPFRVETTQQVQYDVGSSIVSGREAPIPWQFNARY